VSCTSVPVPVPVPVAVPDTDTYALIHHDHGAAQHSPADIDYDAAVLAAVLTVAIGSAGVVSVMALLPFFHYLVIRF
jgi:hypothetical protein